MTVVYNDSQPGRAEAHVLIVGIGAYPYFVGGTEPTVKFARDNGLGQLSSPTISARALADWFVTGYTNPDVPLGSVALLLSEPADAEYANPATGQAFPVARATIRNILAEIRDWRKRCAEQADNASVFYIAGHGIDLAGDRCVLAEDFPDGQDDEVVSFASALNLSRFQAAMGKTTQNRFQWFFFDACMPILESFDANDAQAGLSAARANEAQRAPQLGVFAAAPNTFAYGHEGEPTRFMRALSEALQNGRAATKNRDTNKWEVSAVHFFEALSQIMTEINEADGGTPQFLDPPIWQGDFSAAALHQPADPKVALTIYCKPGQATGSASFTLQSRANRATKFVRDPADDDWRLLVSASNYNLAVNFLNTRYMLSPDFDDIVVATTPSTRVEVEVIRP